MLKFVINDRGEYHWQFCPMIQAVCLAYSSGIQTILLSKLPMLFLLYHVSELREKCPKFAKLDLTSLDIIVRGGAYVRTLVDTGLWLVIKLGAWTTDKVHLLTVNAAVEHTTVPVTVCIEAIFEVRATEVQPFRRAVAWSPLHLTSNLVLWHAGSLVLIKPCSRSTEV